MDRKQFQNHLDALANKSSSLQSQFRYFAPDLDECDSLLQDIRRRVDQIEKEVKEEGWPLQGRKSGS